MNFISSILTLLTLISYKTFTLIIHLCSCKSLKKCIIKSALYYPIDHILRHLAKRISSLSKYSFSNVSHKPKWLY